MPCQKDHQKKIYLSHITVLDKGSKPKTLKDMVQITSEIQVEKENYCNEIRYALET